MRRSIATTRTHTLGNWTKWAQRRSNTSFLSEALKTAAEHKSGGGNGTVVLIGSCDLPGVTVRQAQAVLRNDRRPSFWSHALLITADWDGSSSGLRKLPVAEISLNPRNGQFSSPASNGVATDITLGDYLDADRDANLGVFNVCNVTDQGATALSAEQLERMHEVINDPNQDRQRHDLWSNLCAWQRYLWSDGQGDNPLRSGQPVPAASFIDMVFESIGLDLTPGASERNASPEHFWHTFRWWLQQDVQQQMAVGSPFTVSGCYVLRDPGCTSMR